MRKLVLLFFVTAIFVTATTAQTKKTRPVAKPAIDKGKLVGSAYLNETFGFTVSFPASWTFLSNTKILGPVKNVTVLLTAYRSKIGTKDNAVLRIAVEDLSANPQIKDAVDYFDAIRASYAPMKFAEGFTYSETQAEQLGSKQFAYLDTSTKTEKKRMYAAVRDGKAIIFSLAYTKDEDLETFRTLLSKAKFSPR